MTRGVRGRFIAIGVALAVTTSSVEAVAQSRNVPSPPDLKTARELFQEAYKREQEGRFAEALETFRRVAIVRESASVRYRIASVLESLGRLREARDAFRALAAAQRSLPTNEQEISESAAERADGLDKRIPRIVLKLEADPPADARVTIDGAPVPASTEPRHVELDPGEHVVRATAPTARPSESRVTLTEGGEVAMTVVLERIVPVERSEPVALAPAPAAPPAASNSLAYVALAAGGVLLVTGSVLLFVRESNIDDLNDQCSGGACPLSKKSELESTRDQAELFGPLGIGIGIAGLVVAGTGALFLVARGAARSAGSATADSNKGVGGLRVHSNAVRGGAVLGIFGSF